MCFLQVLVQIRLGEQDLVLVSHHRQFDGLPCLRVWFGISLPQKPQSMKGARPSLHFLCPVFVDKFLVCVWIPELLAIIPHSLSVLSHRLERNLIFVITNQTIFQKIPSLLPTPKHVLESLKQVMKSLRLSCFLYERGITMITSKSTPPDYFGAHSHIC